MTYLAVLLLYSGLKYVLMTYQGWVGESAVKTGRDQLAAVASKTTRRRHTGAGQTANIIGNEIDGVGGFVGTSISEFVVNASMMVIALSYMVYVQPVIAAFTAVAILPSISVRKHLATKPELQGRTPGDVGSQAWKTKPSDFCRSDLGFKPRCARLGRSFTTGWSCIY